MMDLYPRFMLLTKRERWLQLPACDDVEDGDEVEASSSEESEDEAGDGEEECVALEVVMMDWEVMMMDAYEDLKSRDPPIFRVVTVDESQEQVIEEFRALDWNESPYSLGNRLEAEEIYRVFR